MASFPCVHHIEIGVTDGPKVVNILRKNFTFDVVAARNSKVARQWLLRKHDTRYLVTCLKSTDKEHIRRDNYAIDWMDVPNMTRWDYTQERPRKDSVFNICLQVDNLDKVMERLGTHGVMPFKDVKTISDPFGSVRTCTIKSCVGDVYHTLIEKEDNYSGVFLPEFREIDCDNCDSTKDTSGIKDVDTMCPVCIDSDVTCQKGKETDSKVRITTNSSSSSSRRSLDHDSTWTSFDHVAFAVEMGKSPEVIDWYERCFGMKRFFINNEEEDNSGLVLSTEDVGLRLRAMEYWRCAETGIAGPKVDTSITRGHRLSFVIVEGLPPYPGTNAINQVESWLRQHGGPGVNHIALATDDIKGTVGDLQQSGVNFANPPPDEYYSEAGRLPDIQKAGEDVDILRQHGILIDTEANRIGDGEEQAVPEEEKYLLQIFTEPLLPKDAFFMELIQRAGATGFGSGNVAALYRSVQASIIKKAQPST